VGAVEPELLLLPPVVTDVSGLDGIPAHVVLDSFLRFDEPIDAAPPAGSMLGEDTDRSPSMVSSLPLRPEEETQSKSRGYGKMIRKNMTARWFRPTRSTTRSLFLPPPAKASPDN